MRHFGVHQISSESNSKTSEKFKSIKKANISWSSSKILRNETSWTEADEAVVQAAKQPALSR
jgi:hypothetical protein